jgi:pyruvate dehydrogenase E2 component (dihydrolipoamide acetyltransferase)
MAIPVIMPKQGQSVETCIITKWFKQKGDNINIGDILFSYETDKASFDMESPADGTLLEILYDNGAEVPILVPVAVIGLPGESTETVINGVSPAEIKYEPERDSSEKEKITEIIPSSRLIHEADNTRVRISPRARVLARNNGLFINTLSGSGPNGRIVVSDIEKLLTGPMEKTAASEKQTTEFTELPLSNVRKIIARSMHSSLQQSAQLTHHMSADVRGLLDARRKIKEETAKGTSGPDITLNDMICWCVIKALLKFPEANSHFLDDRIRTFNRVHLGIAVDTPRGLIVPAIKNADLLNLEQLSSELKSVAVSCKKGNINPELIQSTSASFTVSNLGNYGVEMFTPVINLPQAAILGVCTIINRPADLGNGIFGFIPYIGLSLTYDHRAIDGGPATLFLREIKNEIEKFSL